MGYRVRSALLAAILAPCLISAAPQEHGKLAAGDKVPFEGMIVGDMDVSGIARVGDYLVIVSDESASVQILKKTATGYKVHSSVVVGDKDAELDLEAVAADGQTVYVTGSHNRFRHIGAKSKLGDGGVGPIDQQLTRDVVYRFTLKEDGTAGPVEATTLRKTIDAHPVLKEFSPLASKENGIDIEALAAKDGQLYFGFRGPILRDNWIPVLVTKFDKTQTAEVRYVKLDGRGIRDLAAVSGGFLVLAGPMGDGDQTFRIYHWNGQSGLPEGPDAGKATLLATIPENGRGKPEGIGVMAEDPQGYDLVIVSDGLKNGDATRFRLTRTP